MNAPFAFFGIRHHGPGCARSLRKALDALQPDCVLIEGPAGSEALLAHLSDAALQPPVALLSYHADDPQLALFHPYALFSPEWQAMQWAGQAGVPVRFIDVPSDISLAWLRRERDAARALAAAREQSDSETDDDVADDNGGTANNVVSNTAAKPESSDDARDNLSGAPLDWLARAAGYGDGESWWNHMVEERGDGEGLFDAIAAAMTALRDETPPPRARDDEAQETVREAHMRQCLREAEKAGFARIAVVCGAWHVPALQTQTSAAGDKAILKGVEKLKAHTTWVPWTYRHLSSRSGYAAGIESPGWYEYLWRAGQGETRAAGWFTRVARLLREHDLDCSSAHLIEATRLADTLAALRERPAPGLDELNEAALSILCGGEDAPMRLIAERLMVGDAIGGVPTDVPTVPLQRDLEAQQKTLRLKPEALTKNLDLDLRKDNDLRRSQLLHRLGLLGIDWGSLARTGASGKGTFHEIWTLAWEPRYQVDIIMASRHGHTLETAATASAAEQAAQAERLEQLTALMDKVLLANLPDAVTTVAAELETRAAGHADPLALLDALPALANVYRYGNVRRTDIAQVAHLFDSMLLRACIGLSLATGGLDEEAADAARTTLLGADRAVSLRDGDEQTQAWQQALLSISASESAAPLLRGLACRLLLDSGIHTVEDAQRHISLNLSAGTEPLDAAQWLDGFLNRNAAVLLHNDALWSLIDEWLCALGDEHFIGIAPLVRRTFSAFEPAERRDLAQRVKQPLRQTPAKTDSPEWDETRAMRALPTLRELLGIETGDALPPSRTATP